MVPADHTGSGGHWPAQRPGAGTAEEKAETKPRGNIRENNVKWLKVTH